MQCDHTVGTYYNDYYNDYYGEMNFLLLSEYNKCSKTNKLYLFKFCPDCGEAITESLLNANVESKS